MLGEEDGMPETPNFYPDKFFNPGSDIFLKCFILRHLIHNATVKEMANVSWKKDGVLLDLQSQERMRKVLLVSMTILIVSLQHGAGDQGGHGGEHHAC